MIAALDTGSLLADHERGLERAAGRGRRLVSVTAPAEIADPCGAVFASRLASDRWYCW